MKKLLLFNLIAIFYTLVFCGQAFAQMPSGEIKGVVITADGIPAAHVNIQTDNKTTVSNSNGEYSLKNVQPGTYAVKVSFVGLSSQEKMATVAAGETVVLNFTISEDSRRLSEVIVTANRGKLEPVAIGKLGISPMDMPQSSSIISGQVITEQQSSRLSDVMKNVSGVAMADTRGATSEKFFARGYSLGANDFFKNGSRYNSGSIPEISTLERVEVLKGSAAMLYGNVTSGAIINLVTKRPKFEYGGEISLRTGSFNTYKPTGDIYGPITKDLAFRLIGTVEDNGSYRNSVKSDKYYINPSLLYKAGKKTEILLQGDYLKYHLTPDFGIGSLDGKIPTNIPRSNFYNTPWAYNRVTQTTTSATVDHQFNDSWKLNIIGSYQFFDRNYYSTERIQADAAGDWSRSLTRSKTTEDYYTIQANLSGKINTGKIKHTLLIGSDADSYVNLSHAFNFKSAYDKINLLNPEKYQARVDMPVAKDSLRTGAPTYRLGYYAQDLISLSEKFKVLAGLRWSYQKAFSPDILNLITGTRSKSSTPGKADQAFSPRFGIIYQPVKSISLFASYSNNFSVNTGIDIYDQALSPSIIDQFEAGIKNDLLNGKLSASFTVYKIINNNLAQQAEFLKDGTTLNTNSNIKELSGQTTSDGAEFELSGTLLQDLNFIAGYSFNYMRYTKTSGAAGSYIEGERLINNPAHTANTSIFYTFSNGKLHGFKIGASGYYIGKRNAGWNNKVGQTQSGSRLIPMNGFATCDLSAGYSYNKFSILAKIANVTNELNYYVHENYSVNPIAPRNFLTTLSYKF